MCPEVQLSMTLRMVPLVCRVLSSSHNQMGLVKDRVENSTVIATRHPIVPSLNIPSDDVGCTVMKWGAWGLHLVEEAAFQCFS